MSKITRLKLSLIFLLLFCSLILLIKLHTPIILKIDTFAQQISGYFLNPITFKIMRTFTNLASQTSTTLLGLLLAGILWYKKFFTRGIVVLILLGSLNLISLKLKYLIMRPRPTNKLYAIGGYSFPSGHTFAAASLALLSSYFLFSQLQNQALRLSLTILGWSFALLIAFSRIFLRVHFFTDTLGSFLLLGFLWNFLWLLIPPKFIHNVKH